MYSQSLPIDCPCELNCPNGCVDCPNVICGTTTVPTSFEITTTAVTTTKMPVYNAVLVLSSMNSNNKPMVVDFNG